MHVETNEANDVSGWPQVNRKIFRGALSGDPLLQHGLQMLTIFMNTENEFIVTEGFRIASGEQGASKNASYSTCANRCHRLGVRHDAFRG
jgi:hypothetical protein